MGWRILVRGGGGRALLDLGGLVGHVGHVGVDSGHGGVMVLTRVYVADTFSLCWDLWFTRW